MISKKEQLVRKIFAWLLIYLMSIQPFFTSFAYAQTQAQPDPNQGKNPHVTNAPNGTVVVDIRGPNANGLSHNQYLNLQVGRDGIIFNNGLGISNTQLAGYINGNAHLNGRQATAILNEVTGALPTNINGYMEVAGRRADLIIANPNGIVGNNFGFINTNRAVLTTGIPQIQNGNLNGFVVNGGEISIEGQGMDARGATKTEIMANAVKINATMHANDLSIVTGNNEIDYNTGAVRALETESQGGISLDVAALGSMYAGRITLVGTSKGLGVNNEGTISATGGNLTLTQEGKVVLNGTTQAVGAVNIAANDDITNTGTLYGQKDVNLSATGRIDNTDGIVKAEGNLEITASGDVTNTKISDGGQLEAAGISIKSNNLESTGNILAFEKNLSLENSGQVSLNGTTYAKGNINISGNSELLLQGTTYAKNNVILDTKGKIQNTDGIIKADGSLEITTTGDVENIKTTDGGQMEAATVEINSNNLTSGGNIVALAGDMNLTQSGQASLSGTTYAEGKLTANSGNLVNEGTVYAKDDISLTAGSDIENKGTVKSESNLDINAAGELKNNSSQQSVLEAQNVNIKAAAVDNSNSLINNLSTNEMKIQTGSLQNTSGQILSQGNLALTANSASNSEGILYSGAKTDITADSLESSGEILSKDELSLKINNNFTNDGEVKTNANLKISGTGDITNTGNLATAQNMEVNVNNLDNQGSIQASELAVNANKNIENTGLINSADKLTMSANTISNRDTGRIYGTDVHIDATILNNTGNGSDAPVIASRNNMYIGAGTINNKEHALLLSEGDMFIGGALDNGNVTGATDTINNHSATIEAKEKLFIEANTINNVNEHFEVEKVMVSGSDEKRYDYQGHGSQYVPPTGRYYWGSSPVRVFANYNEAQANKRPGEIFMEWSWSTGHSAKSLNLVLPMVTTVRYTSFSVYEYTRATYEDVIKTSDPGKILSGKNMTINAELVENDKSSIIAGGNILGTIGTLNNTEVTGGRYSVDEGTRTYYYRTGETTSTSASKFRDENILENITIGGFKFEDKTAVGADGSDEKAQGFNGPTISQVTTEQGAINSIDFSNDGNTISNMVDQLNNSLYIVNTNPTAKSYIETDPAFTNYKNFISSDYFLSQLDYDPNTHAKRLGDAYYEQQLIKEQIMQLTGNRFVKGFTDDNGQYQALMDAALKFAQENNLIVGVELTAEQLSKLGESMVWMVEKQVMLPDGQIVTALVPQVYIVDDGQTNIGAAVISGQNIDFNIVNDILNSGTIKASDTVKISATNINNIGGQIKASDVGLKATNDINNIGGSITAKDSIYLDAGNDINIKASTNVKETTSTAIDIVHEKQISFGAAGSIVLTGDSASLVMNAGNDVNLKGANIENKGENSTTIINAENDVNIGEVTLSRSYEAASKANTYNTYSSKSSADVGSSIEVGGDISINAGNDINVKASSIVGEKDVSFTAENNVNISSGEQKYDYSHKAAYSFTGDATVKQTEHVSSNISGENVSIKAGEDINVKGGLVFGENSVNLQAENDIIISADKDVYQSDHTQGKRGSYYFDHEAEYHEAVQGSVIVSNNEIKIQAGQDLTIKGSSIINTEGQTSLSGENVNILNETEKHTSLIETEREGRNKKTTIYDYQSGEMVVGSIIDSGEIDITSKADTNIVGSTVIADRDIDINAGGDINIESAEQKSESVYIKEVKKSGVFSGGGLGITVGTQKQKDSYNSNGTTQVGSMVGSLSGDVNINAGQDVNIRASDLFAGQDINIEGDSVTIENKDHVYNFNEKHEFKQSGLTVGIGGTAYNTIDKVWSPAQRATEVSDSRLAALYGVKTGIELEKAISSGVDLGNKNNWSINIGFGTSKSKSESSSTTIISQGSNISAVGDVNITAREKDLTIAGSTVSGENVTLEAKENVNITASDNTNTSKTDSKSSSAGVGISVGFGGGIGGYVSGSSSKGNIRENGTTWNESIVTAGDTLTIKAGEDTNIIGSQVKGDTVQMEVGGDLNIESLQDTEKYKEKNTGVSVGIGINPGGSVSVSGGASQQKIDSDYKSVQEQAGIYAGEGGFDIEVGGNTDLKGAVIASEADADKNRLSTGTLTYSDIENKAEWEANTVGANINHNFSNGDKAGNQMSGSDVQSTPEGKDKGFTPNFGGSDGEASSVTKSAIAEGEIEIRDNPDQDISDLSRDTATANNPLNTIFDRDKILEKQEAASLFGEIGFTLVGSIIHKKEDSGEWDKGDPRAIALHALVGGIMSEINGGSFGEGLTVAAVNKLLVAELTKKGELSAEEARWISATLGFVMASQQGAMIADIATQNNEKGRVLTIEGSKILGGGQTIGFVENTDGEKVFFITNNFSISIGVAPISTGAQDVETIHENIPKLEDYLSGIGMSFDVNAFFSWSGNSSFSVYDFDYNKGTYERPGLISSGYKTDLSLGVSFGNTTVYGKDQNGINKLLAAGVSQNEINRLLRGF